MSDKTNEAAMPVRNPRFFTKNGEFLWAHSFRYRKVSN